MVLPTTSTAPRRDTTGEHPTLHTGRTHKHQQKVTELHRLIDTAIARQTSKNTRRSAQPVPDEPR